jgi:hypothetical protein
MTDMLTPGEGGECTDVTVMLSRRSIGSLLIAAQIGGLNRTDTINRAIQVYDRMLREAERGGRVVVVRARCGCAEEISL